jgi:hypothetical protein
MGSDLVFRIVVITLGTLPVALMIAVILIM